MREISSVIEAISIWFMERRNQAEFSIDRGNTLGQTICCGKGFGAEASDGCGDRIQR